MPRKADKTTDTKAPPATKPAEEAIRRRAYELHLERGGVHGSDLDDWLRAEREIEAQHQRTPARRKASRKKG